MSCLDKQCSNITNAGQFLLLLLRNQQFALKGTEETSELESDTWLSLLPDSWHHGIADLKVLFSFSFLPLSMLIIIIQTPARSPLWSWGLDPSLHSCPPSRPVYLAFIVFWLSFWSIFCFCILSYANCDALCILRPFCNNLTNLHSFSLTYILLGWPTLDSFYTMTPWLGDHSSTGPGATLTDTDRSHRLIYMCFIIHYHYLKILEHFHMHYYKSRMMLKVILFANV